MGLLPDEWYDEIFEILDNTEVDEDGNVTFSEKNTRLIHDFAPKCRNTNLYKNTIGLAREWIKRATAEEVYLHMIYKMNHAPLKIYVELTPIMLIPIISDKLKEAGGERNG
jgi:hypothetical protein